MTVFANGLEVSAKKQGCKVIAAFPDTCFTPPQTPATPPGVPIPYPNFATDSDLTSGTGTVKIGGETVSQENSSKFSKVSGDEAGSAPKKGIITSNNRGAAYAKKWSMDVKAEGKGLVRFSDLATTNHASDTGDDAPWLIAAKANPAWTGTCDRIYQERMSTYDPNECATPEFESHHLIDNSSFTRPGARGTPKNTFASAVNMGARVWKKLWNLFQPGSPHPGRNYHEGDPPCICLEGNPNDPGTEHAVAHDITEKAAARSPTASQGKWTYGEARAAALKSAKKSAGLTEKETECVGLMLDAYYKDELGCTDSTEIRAPGTQPAPGTQFATGHGRNANMSPAPL